MAVWLSSDFHFSHRNYCRGTSEWTNKDKCRNFDTVEEMNGTLLENINSTVAADDELYFLGDWVLAVPNKMQATADLRSQIRCRTVHCVRGNHDLFSKYYYEDKEIIRQYEQIFTTVHDLWTTRIKGRLVTLCHYAMYTFPFQNKQGIAAYGHSHGSLRGLEHVRTVDVGVDCWGLRPLSWNQYLEVVMSKPQIAIDHHQ